MNLTLDSAREWWEQKRSDIPDDDAIGFLFDEIDRLTAEIDQLKFDRDKYIKLWNAQCLIAEELDAENQRMRAALERIAADNIGAIYPFSSTQTVAERQSDIAREELERGKE